LSLSIITNDCLYLLICCLFSKLKRLLLLFMLNLQRVFQHQVHHHQVLKHSSEVVYSTLQCKSLSKVISLTFQRGMLTFFSSITFGLIREKKDVQTGSVYTLGKIPPKEKEKTQLKSIVLNILLFKLLNSHLKTISEGISKVDETSSIIKKKEKPLSFLDSLHEKCVCLFVCLIVFLIHKQTQREKRIS